MRHRDQDGIGRLDSSSDQRDAVLVRRGHFLANGSWTWASIPELAEFTDHLDD
jgi:hypothetical protein